MVGVGRSVVHIGLGLGLVTVWFLSRCFLLLSLLWNCAAFSKMLSHKIQCCSLIVNDSEP